MASLIAILDLKGKSLIQRSYKDDIPASTVDRFMPIVLDMEEDLQTVTPCFTKDGVNYMHIRYSNLYILALSKNNSNAAEIILFLHKLASVFTEYFKELEEESIRDNFVIIYELFDEMMDYGHPQTTESKILQEYITQESYKLESQARPPMAVTNAVSWRSEGIRYRKNEVFLDVVESVNMLVNASGNVIRSEILGAVKMKCFLTGMPELRLGLNDKVMFETTGRTNRGKSIEMEDVKFHQCVRLSRFENDRTISFIPPDGEFELMSYRLSTSVKPLVWAEASIEYHSGSRVEYTVKVKANFKKRSSANNVEILIPVPDDADTPKFRSATGSVSYAPDQSCFIWKIKQLAGGKEFLLRAEFGLPSVKGDDIQSKRPILVKFEIPYFTVSGIQVRYLKIVEKSGYQALPWVRYLTNDGDYALRTNVDRTNNEISQNEMQRSPLKPKFNREISLADAAANAEFAEKKRVWVPDHKEGYLSGWVAKENGEEWDVVCNSETRTMRSDLLSPQNPPRFDKVSDIAELTFLNEASVVHNLRSRYGSDLIYTYSGLFLVAVNPYRDLPIYTDAHVQAYRNKRREDNAPHIFAVTDRAWNDMMAERENQSVLITGESGAGKTENTKKVIQYLASIASNSAGRVDSLSRSTQPRTPSRTPTAFSTPVSVPNSPSLGQSITPSSSMTSLGTLERQILQANPILESFGNAQTVRNNNSSRFGKFVRIEFSTKGQIAGAHIDWYLLEKSRVSSRSNQERSFHVFYHFLNGADQDLLDALQIPSADINHYNYLSKTRKQVDGIDDEKEWDMLIGALDVLGFDKEEQLNLFRVVGAILHLGNIDIKGDRSGQARIEDKDALERLSLVLGLSSSKELEQSIINPRVMAGKETVIQSRSESQAKAEVASLAKTIYEKNFSKLIEKVNTVLDRATESNTFIGVLDIAGFEIFKKNSFEQLCINYTNECLQQYFNHHMFVLEQEEYQREGIEWNFVNFGLDLQPTINLIESVSPIGILSCLDEECIMPKANDQTFTQKLTSLCMNRDDGSKLKFSKSKFGDEGFIVQHYAGKVEYDTEAWLEKNKDPINDHLTKVLSNSSDAYIADLFSEYTPDDRKASRGGKGGAFRTVAQRHKEQLNALMRQLNSTEPHFVRCILPNSIKKPGRIEVNLVLDQLRCNGVLEGIRIARLGYPNRLPFSEFRSRYGVLTPNVLSVHYMDARKVCQRMLESLELDSELYRIGNSKIFFKSGVLAEMEERRDNILYDLFTSIQASSRGFITRRIIHKLRNKANAALIINRNAELSNNLSQWAWWRVFNKVRPLLTATRSEEEIRKREDQLQSMQRRLEFIEKDQQANNSEQRRIQKLLMSTQTALETERDQSLQNSHLIERFQTREVEMSEEIDNHRAFIKDLENQLEKALNGMKEAESRHQDLRSDFDIASTEILRLESTVADNSKMKELANDYEHRLAVTSSERDKFGRELQALRSKLTETLHQLQEFEEKSTRFDDISLRCQEVESELADVVLQFKHSKSTRDDELEEMREQLTQSIEDAETSRSEIESLKKRALDAESYEDNYKRLKQDYDEEVQRAVEAETYKVNYERLQQNYDEVVKRALHAEAYKDSYERLKQDYDEEVQRAVEAETYKVNYERLQQDYDEVVERALHAEAHKDNYERLKQDYDEEVLQHDALRQGTVEKNNDIKLLQSQLQQSENKSERIKSEFESFRRLQSEYDSTLRQLHQSEEKNQRIMNEFESILAVQTEFESTLRQSQQDNDQLQRALQLSHKKQNDYEDACLDLEKERDELRIERDNIRQSNEVLTYDIKSVEDRRSQESKSRKVDMNNLKEVISDLETKLSVMKDDLLASQQEVDLLSRSRSDKTVIEHVHVLEEAKRVTDRQLRESRMEITNMSTQMKSAEKIKSRLTPEQLTELEIRLRTPTDKRLLELEQIIKMKEKDCENVYKKLEEARNVIEVEKRRYQRDLKMQEEDNRRLEEDIEVLRARSRTMSSGLDRDSALRASNRSLHGNHHSQSISSMPPPPTPPISYTPYSSKPTPELGKRYSFESARASFNKM
ncbi:hypothetical protein E3P96_00437 [Wallemia ichthyophaga]|nr:hypothetical protein E3P96_00437 [Wallemia ichthyophaga]